MICIQTNTKCKFDYIIDDIVPETAKAKAIMDNFANGRIPDDKKPESLVFALKNAPMDLDIYRTIWVEYGDESGDLRKMAEYFGVPLSEHVISLVKTYSEEVYLKNCKEYEDALNPIFAAIKIEQNIINTRNEIIEFCNKQDIQIDNIDVVKKCDSILEYIENELCTVNGVKYESRQIAEEIKQDRDRFYSFLQDKKLSTDNLFEELCKIEFESDLYKNKLGDLFKEEIQLRDSLKISSNLKSIMTKYFPDVTTKLGNIEFARLNNSLEQKEGTIRDITHMPEYEMPIMLINFTTSGKSGILLTNLSLRIYNKGLLSSLSNFVNFDDINDVNGLICCGQNKYFIDTVKGRFEFTIKSGLSIKEQNLLCHFLQESIFIIKNLQISERMNLKWIDFDSLKCVCGTLLPKGTNICPLCFKIYTVKGEFVDTITCKNCGNRIQIGKKFCNRCGKSVTDKETDTLNDKFSLKDSWQFCPRCGNLVMVGKKFCNQCGTPLGKVENNHE